MYKRQVPDPGSLQLDLRGILLSEGRGKGVDGRGEEGMEGYRGGT